MIDAIVNILQKRKYTIYGKLYNNMGISVQQFQIYCHSFLNNALRVRCIIKVQYKYTTETLQQILETSISIKKTRTHARTHARTPYTNTHRHPYAHMQISNVVIVPYLLHPVLYVQDPQSVLRCPGRLLKQTFVLGYLEVS